MNQSIVQVNRQLTRVKLMAAIIKINSISPHANKAQSQLVLSILSLHLDQQKQAKTVGTPYDALPAALIDWLSTASCLKRRDASWHRVISVIGSIQ